MRKAHPYGTIDPFLQIDVADIVLNEIFQITEQLKIKAFLIFGLCLGFVRDGGYIEEDNDLDVGVICDREKKNALINTLENNGFDQGRSFLPPHNNIHFYKNKALVDIHFQKLSEFYFSFDSVHYKGKEYPVPHPVEAYLSACYSNWKAKEHQVTHY